jgi:hypothetical protein
MDYVGEHWRCTSVTAFHCPASVSGGQR